MLLCHLMHICSWNPTWSSRWSLGESSAKVSCDSNTIWGQKLRSQDPMRAKSCAAKKPWGSWMSSALALCLP